MRFPLLVSISPTIPVEGNCPFAGIQSRLNLGETLQPSIFGCSRITIAGAARLRLSL
ncbi:MAG: hypothetical protein JW739_05310 [Opitutales bacterium]|nr:hypothetical protein [Opitutales bacterium]